MSRSNTPALSRAGSRSSLWRSWSPMLEDLVNYEKSRENYPWLIRNHDQDTSYDSNRSSRPRPLASLAEDPDVVSQSDQSRKSSEDLERHPAPEPLLLPQDEDPNLLGGGVLSDCWRKEERGTATAIYSLAPFLGPAVGPIAAGYLTQHLNWRWIFWVVSIADAVVQILAFLFLQETYPPKILKVKARKLRKITGNRLLHTEFEQRDRTFLSLLLTNLKRPFRMLFTQPAIQITALYRAYLYGLMYLVFASFPMVWEQQYNQEPGRASLNYVSLGIGFVIGLQVSGPLIDKVYAMLKTRYNHPGRPEFRVPLMFPTAVITPAGLVLYGVSAHLKLHWIIPNVGTAIFSAGLILSFQCAQTYIIDSYERYAASATGAAAFVRTMAGFSFPLFAPAMYKRLGIAWGNGLLAGTAMLICLVAPIVLWRHGEWIRRKSPYCAG
ncbi:hypothetical protein FOXG_05602 [Fusarium oxysporum f. sp. lycopersici 4287]|uniref:Major facilitator superfamily (MFS) profile domain-containing protein n=1 Tax=Fusarium oxysporum f. sp. lycopersici (strain 4287 / CBS 123668 / FGSC 9935 / NRRL 34936) TaxID=426428 RepID=A0A0J9UUV3_FUSO4|nr:hypothetical protein FOXG_05602 [Fusarium oxysporum f. sp. lycopersici 4287]KNB02985.1 hypothetical protein FOXG_05602 [Fusarium oxysporum f. sp. lycopersici 4287]